MQAASVDVFSHGEEGNVQKAVIENRERGESRAPGFAYTNPEPLPAEDPLWDYDNVLLTPHVSGAFLLRSTVDRVIEIAGNNLCRYSHGEKPDHVVDRKAGY